MRTPLAGISALIASTAPAVDDPDVALPRRRGEDCRNYRFRLQVHIQEQLTLRDRLEENLELLLASERRCARA